MSLVSKFAWLSWWKYFRPSRQCARYGKNDSRLWGWRLWRTLYYASALEAKCFHTCFGYTYGRREPIRRRVRHSKRTCLHCAGRKSILYDRYCGYSTQARLVRQFSKLQEVDGVYDRDLKRMTMREL